MPEAQKSQPVKPKTREEVLKELKKLKTYQLEKLVVMVKEIEELNVLDETNSIIRNLKNLSANQIKLLYRRYADQFSVLDFITQDRPPKVDNRSSGFHFDSWLAQMRQFDVSNFDKVQLRRAYSAGFQRASEIAEKKQQIQESK